MNIVPAVIRSGQVELAHPVDWPDGTPVEVVPVRNGNTKSGTLESWPPGFFERLRRDWGNEPFERPAQGEFETREEW